MAKTPTKPAEKPFWKSSTFWINAAGIAAIGLDLAAQHGMDMGQRPGQDHHD